ncbi:MAG: hypothetical protein IJT76_09430 [Clostridia bacterium]|nr:hypothetical protein [Clostridia bacterium]
MQLFHHTAIIRVFRQQFFIDELPVILISESDLVVCLCGRFCENGFLRLMIQPLHNMVEASLWASHLCRRASCGVFSVLVLCRSCRAASRCTGKASEPAHRRLCTDTPSVSLTRGAIFPKELSAVLLAGDRRLRNLRESKGRRIRKGIPAVLFPAVFHFFQRVRHFPVFKTFLTGADKSAQQEAHNKANAEAHPSQRHLCWKPAKGNHEQKDQNNRAEKHRHGAGGDACLPDDCFRKKQKPEEHDTRAQQEKLCQRRHGNPFFPQGKQGGYFLRGIA